MAKIKCATQLRILDNGYIHRWLLWNKPDLLHRILPSKKTKWTKSMLLKEAKKYSYRKDFLKGNPSAYQKARKMKILDECCKHMEPLNFFWDEESVRKEAKKYTELKEFRKSHACKFSRKLGIFDEVTKHMSRRFIWTEDMVIKEAKKYRTKKDFYSNSESAYNRAIKLGILDQICSHMDGFDD